LNNIPQFRKSVESATPTLNRLGVLAVQDNLVLCKNLQFIMKTLQQIDWLKWTLAVTVLSIIGSGVYSAIVNL